MAEIINTIPLDPTTFEFQEYSLNDTSLITSVEVENSFNPLTDHIEYFIYDLNGNILTSNVSGYNGYRLLDNVLTIYPETDLTTQGFTEGQYNTLYNFVSNKLSSDPNNNYFISQISPDRTEVRLDTTSIPNALVISSSMELMNDITTSTGSYYDFYLDFGNNELIIANNVLLDTSSINNPTVLIKLYEALPQQFDINSQCWVVTQVATPVAYNINITQTFDIADNYIYLKGPNTNLSIQNQVNNSTDYSNLNQLSTTDSIQGSGSLRYQLNSILVNKGIEINVDYSNYSDFIHFSSAQTRLENFYYKLSLIEQYNYSASLSNNTITNYYVSSSNIIWQSKIDEIITGFDNYEYFLYYNSGSACWPKTGNTPPYTNYPTTSTSGSNWFVSQSLVAEEYDIENNNALINTIPSYLLEDPENYQYELFIEMIGQHFDNVFLYTQDVTNKYNNDNRLNYGVSKDLVADILRDMGIKIYQNNFSTNDLYSALLGLTPSGSLYNLPYTTGSLPTPSGYEYINTYVTASSTSSLIPTEDLNAEIYKRIYANLPYLLKKKGTVEGLRALVTLYGIPDTILQVNEFGGQNKIIENDYDLWFNQYNYAFDTLGTNYVTSSFELNSSWNSLNNRPNAVEIRFQTRGIPSNAGYYSQSIWTTNENTALILRYTGSAYTSGSYSGSITNPYNEFALLEFYPDVLLPTTTASVYLPFLDKGWWSVIVDRNIVDPTLFTLVAANKNYDGEDGNYIGFQASSSVNYNSDSWEISQKFYLGYNNGLTLGKTFSGSFQELRFYTTPLSQSEFADYVMNPYSIDANGVNTAPDTLAFRATLGGELYTSSISVHPKVTGSWVTTQSFTNTSTFKFNTTPVFVPNTEIFYLNQFPAGIKNRVSNKIRQQTEILPYSGSDEINLPTNQVLSPFISIQQSVSVSGSYTPNIDYVEVAFSPQNEINNDIASQLGYFNIGEYIGDPRLVSSSAESYPALNTLRDYYFEKYTSNYNIWDYIRLIKYFDNSLFKMIQDWTPARTDAATGIVIKQTVLERNKYPVPQPNITSSIAWVESGSYSNNILLSTSSLNVVQGIPLSLSITQTETINIVGTWYDNSASTDYTNYIILQPPIGIGTILYQQVLSGIGTSSSFDITTPVSVGDTLQFGTSFTGGSDPAVLTTIVTNSLQFTSSNTPYQTENILITGSSIQMYTISGSTGGTMPNLFGLTSSQYTGNGIVNITQSWSGSTPSLGGLVPFVNSTQEEFYNGELSGSVITVTNGDLNGGNPFLIYPTQQFLYDIETKFLTYGFSVPFTLQEWFEFPVYDGQIDLLSDQTQEEFGDTNLGLIYAKIPRLDLNNNNNTNTLQELKQFSTDINSASNGNYTGIFKIHNIVSIQEKETYYLYTLQPDYINYGQSYFYSDALVILSPVDGTSFINSDFNVLLNNAENARSNPEFFDVDFSSNDITAVNNNIIISASRGQGQATPSTTPASNYTTARIANPRYNGCKNTSPDFNIITDKQLPSVEKYTSYFIYTPGGRGNTLAERSGSGNYQIKFLVDEVGNVITPDLSSSQYLPSLYDAFGSNTTIFLSPTSGSSNTIAQSDFTIYKPAVISNIILYSDTGSLGTSYLVSGSYSSLNFNIVPGLYTQPYGLKVFDIPGQTITSGDTNTASFSNILIDQAGGFNNITDVYTVQNTSPVRAAFSASSNINNLGPGATTVSMSLFENNNLISSQLKNINSGGSTDFFVTASLFLNSGSKYYVTIGTTSHNIAANFNEWSIIPLTSSIVVNKPYFTTGSITTSVLTSSAALGVLYDSYQQTPITGSGFDSPVDLTFQQYDEIRFEGNENLVNTIISSSFNQSTGLFYLFLQSPVNTTSIDVNYFAIRRWVPSVNNIIINSPGTVMSGGFILPKYPSPLLRKNLPSIIENLTNKGLI
jgi:hypothetical protein